MSRDACSLLSHYFDHLTNNRADGVCQLDKSQMHMAETLLSDIHDEFDKVTNCPRHDGEM